MADLTVLDQRGSLPREKDVSLLGLIAWLPFLVMIIWFARPFLIAFANPGTSPRRQNVQLMTESERFKVYALEGYLTPRQADGLLQQAEEARDRLLAFAEIADEGRQMTIIVNPFEAQSQALIPSQSFKLGRANWRAADILYHEMMHLLAGWSSLEFRTEGVAALAEQRLSGKFLPWDLDAVTLATIEILGYSPLATLDHPSAQTNPTRFHIRWFRLIGASFAGHLVDDYGWQRYWQHYAGARYEEVYGRSLAQLEQEWLAKLSALKRRRYTPLIALGLLYTGLLGWATYRPTARGRLLAQGVPGLLAAVAAFMAAPLPLLAAVLLGALSVAATATTITKRWPRGVVWLSLILAGVIVLGLMIIPGGNVILRLV
jgi:hypothetical protein